MRTNAAISTPLVYRPADLYAMLGVTRITLWRWYNNGTFPKPMQLGPHSIGWMAKDVNAWLESRRGEAQGREQEEAVR